MSNTVYSDRKVRLIAQAYVDGKGTIRELADAFGLSATHCASLIQGRWRSATLGPELLAACRARAASRSNHSPKPSAETVAAIREGFHAGVTQVQLAIDHGVPHSRVRRIVADLTRKRIYRQGNAPFMRRSK